MVKMGKFAIAPDNRLVYQSNGAVVRGNVSFGTNRGDIKSRGYTVIKNRVYHNGRLVGYTSSKLTKKAQTIINKRAKTRAVREEKRIRREWIESQVPQYDRSWESFALAKDMMDPYRRATLFYDIGGDVAILSRVEQSKLNFASALKQAVDLGIVDDETASEMWENYSNGSENDRRDLWNEIHSHFNEEGYEIDSPPLYNEMGRFLKDGSELYGKL